MSELTIYIRSTWVLLRHNLNYADTFKESAPRVSMCRWSQDLDDLFGRSLARAVVRREELLARHRAGATPSTAALRRGWIAYPEYWAA